MRKTRRERCGEVDTAALRWWWQWRGGGSVSGSDGSSGGGNGGFMCVWSDPFFLWKLLTMESSLSFTAVREIRRGSNASKRRHGEVSNTHRWGFGGEAAIRGGALSCH